jgi:hypothetical protein
MKFMQGFEDCFAFNRGVPAEGVATPVQTVQRNSRPDNGDLS